MDKDIDDINGIMDEDEIKNLIHSPEDVRNAALNFMEDNPEKFSEMLRDLAHLQEPRWESPIERELRNILHTTRLVVRMQEKFGPFRVDMVLKYPYESSYGSSERIIVECDGSAYHFGLVDDFRDDQLYTYSQIPICHVVGRFINKCPELVALKIIDIFFPEMRTSEDWRANEQDYTNLLADLSYYENQLNILLRRAGLPDVRDSNFKSSFYDRTGKELYDHFECGISFQEWCIDIAPALFRHGHLKPFTLEEFTEGWIYPFQSSGFSTKEKREYLRKKFGYSSIQPYKLAEEYINLFYKGVEQENFLLLLRTYSQRTKLK
jgi:hypothetical protein